MIIPKKVKCIDCGMFVFHKDTDDYREMYGWVRESAQKEGGSYLAYEGEGRTVCYLNVYDMPKSMGQPDVSYDKSFWYDLSPLLTPRRCSKFIAHIPGRMAWHLLKDKRRRRASQVSLITMAAVMMTALATTIIAVLTLLK